MLSALALGAIFAGPAQAQPPVGSRGAEMYQRCYSCHSLNAGEKGLTGPNLDRIVGRAVGADPNFTYSPAFRIFARRNPRWTRPLLERFLADPVAVAPGTVMGFFGFKQAADRAALIAYLAADR